MSEVTIRSLSWRWDKPSCVLWGDCTLTNGSTLSVGLPLAKVVATFDACAVECGLQLPPMVGAVDSVDGFFSSISSAIKSVTRPIAKAAKKAVAATHKVLAKTVAATASVVKSKYLSYALTAVSAVCPAIGGPALAAQLAAKNALNVYEDAKRAKEMVQNGARDAATIARVAKGGTIMRAVQQLPRIATPKAGLAAAALRSLPAPSTRSLPRLPARR
jgi:hypothetical protein